MRSQNEDSEGWRRALSSKRCSQTTVLVNLCLNPFEFPLQITNAKFRNWILQFCYVKRRVLGGRRTRLTKKRSQKSVFANLFFNQWKSLWKQQHKSKKNKFSHAQPKRGLLGVEEGTFEQEMAQKTVLVNLCSNPSNSPCKSLTQNEKSEFSFFVFCKTNIAREDEEDTFEQAELFFLLFASIICCNDFQR